MEGQLIIVDGEAIDPENEIPSIQEYWRARRDAALKDRKPKGRLERFLEAELFALPQGGCYMMKYDEWLRVSGGIKNPYKYIQSRYGSSIICTRNSMGLVVFSKIEGEDLFFDIASEKLKDPFEEKYIGAPVEVEIGDYWYTFPPGDRMRKYRIISFDKETMRYTIELMTTPTKMMLSRVVAEEGFLNYGKPITSRGAPSFPYSSYYDRRWHAGEIKNALFYAQCRAYGLFHSMQKNITDPDALDRMYKLTEAWTSAMLEEKRQLRARMMEMGKRQKELKKRNEQQKWID